MSTRAYEIQTLRTDQGTEYALQEIKRFLNISGIEHVVTGSSAHAQMHVAARIDRTFTEMAQTILIDAGLPKIWWGQAVLYATIIRNRCTT